MPPDYHVSGALTPDATGGYAADGTHDGKPTYRHASLEWWLWWVAEPGDWHLTEQVGVWTPRGWTAVRPDPPGDMEPYGTAEGTATVAAP